MSGEENGSVSGGANIFIPRDRALFRGALDDFRGGAFIETVEIENSPMERAFRGRCRRKGIVWLVANEDERNIFEISSLSAVFPSTLLVERVFPGHKCFTDRRIPISA